MPDRGLLSPDDLIAQADDIADYDVLTLLEACEVFYMNGGADGVSGDVDAPEGHFYRVDRWIVATDSLGFHYLDEYDSEADAIREFEYREEQNAEWDNGHSSDCVACEHDCPWRNNPMGAPFCSICDDHWENGGNEDDA